MRYFDTIAPSTAASQIGIIKDDESALPPKFKQFLDRRGRLRHQQTTDFDRSGKGDLSHRVAFGKHLADIACDARHHLEDTGGNAFFSENTQSKCGERVCSAGLTIIAQPRQVPGPPCG